MFRRSVVVCKSIMKVLTASFACSVVAQDPAGGWMAYAVGTIPQQYERITKLEMTWSVGESPRESQAFFSPWFGMDPADNLNLIQPVNPWSGSSWNMYTEYFQWSPEHNSNSKSYRVEAGQTLRGLLQYNSILDSYTLSQEIVSGPSPPPPPPCHKCTYFWDCPYFASCDSGCCASNSQSEVGVVSSQQVKCQNGKKYKIPYVVYEKEWSCWEYPPDGIVTFRNIVVECDGRDCTQDVQWQARVKDPNCGMAAHVEKASQPTSSNQISITWNTQMESRFDNWTAVELIQHNAKGWGEKYATEALHRIQQASTVV